MSNLTKLIASCCLTALVLIIASVYVHYADGFPRHLDTMLAFSAGFIGSISALFGFVSTSNSD